MSDLPDRLHTRGRRIAAQRRVVTEVLNGVHIIHLSADEVPARATTRRPEIS